MYIILTSAQSPHGKCGHVHCAVCAAISVSVSVGNLVLEIMIKTCQPRPKGEKEEQGWHSWLVRSLWCARSQVRSSVLAHP